MKPVKVWTTPNGRKIFDFGGNSSGIVTLKVHLPKGTKVTLFYTEEEKDGDLDYRSHRGLIQHDEFLAAGTGGTEVYRSRFTYHGFRYVGVEDARAKVVAALADRVRVTDEKHLTCGIYGTRWIGDAMLENELGGLWLEMMHTDTYPGFGYIRAFGGTSLWEDWKPYGGALGMQSHNHAMRAGAVSCFLTHLGGIRPAADGFSSVLIKPICPEGLDRVTVTRRLEAGTVSVSWHRDGDRIRFRINTPPALPVRIELPPKGMRE